MKKGLFIVLTLVILLLTGGMISAQSPEPTQTPYIIYVVVTATPEPEEPVVTAPAAPESIQIVDEAEDAFILRPTQTAPIMLVNDGTGEQPAAGTVSITNQTTNTYAGSTEELVQRVVATVMAQADTAAGGTTSTQNYSNTGGAIVRLNDGSTCTMNFQLISEPTYPAGAIIPRGEVFWKEWLIQNTGTCTWTSEWEFVFDSGWQIGNTRFHMNRTTAPGQTLNVRLAMVPDQKQDGNYYSTYAFEAPDGTRYGTITSSYTVKSPSYFAKPTEVPWNKRPQHGRPVNPKDGPWCPPPYPCCPPWWW